MSNNIEIGTLPGGTTVIAASVDSGKELLTTKDLFVENQSRFDRQARLNLAYDVVHVTLEMYFDYISSQVLEWSSDEINSLQQIMKSISTKFDRLELTLPDRVWLVKTTGQEEGYAAYTRQMNVISLPANMVASLSTSANYGDPLHPADDLTYLENVIIHECFHLFSKNNKQRREELYSFVHYKPTGNNVELPDIPWGPDGSGYTMRDLKITNPDTPTMAYYIEMDVGNGSNEGNKPLLPILLANKPYNGGIFFVYLQWLFMEIEKNYSGQWQPVMTAENKPVLYDSEKLMSQYLKLIGYNLTGELFHPDEIMAQNFVFVANLPSLDLLENMQRILKGTKPPLSLADKE